MATRRRRRRRTSALPCQEAVTPVETNASSLAVDDAIPTSFQLPSRRSARLRLSNQPTEEAHAPAPADINMSPDAELAEDSDDPPMDCNFTPRGPGRPPRRVKPVGVGLPKPDALSAAQARRKHMLGASRQLRLLCLRRRRELLSTENHHGDSDSASASQTMPAPSDSHASLLLGLSEAAVSPPKETNPPIVEEESESRKLEEFGAAPGGQGQEAVVEGRSDHGFSSKMDSQVRGCIVCLKPLKASIFKCQVGYALCSLCHEKLPVKCGLCCKSTGNSSCSALEQFIEAIKVPCSNTGYGCDEFITHDQKEKHESTCTHAPCFCPEYGCSYRGSTASLLGHFVTKHGWSKTNLHYKKSHRISMARDRQYTLFVGEDQSMFLLANTLTDIGNAITLVCIRPHKSGRSYSSKISAVHGVAGAGAEGRLVFLMDPLVASCSLMGGVQLGSFFLLVPPDLVDETTDEITINIRVDEVA